MRTKMKNRLGVAAELLTLDLGTRLGMEPGIGPSLMKDESGSFIRIDSYVEPEKGKDNRELLEEQYTKHSRKGTAAKHMKGGVRKGNPSP